MSRALRDFLEKYPRLLVLTGAGCSAASGIPTYRDDNGHWQRTSPIQHQDFVRYEASRQRYWARSLAGWPAVASAKPNGAHEALAELESRGVIKQLVTQNVDRLHQKAGHRNVIDLHGRLDRIVCLTCGTFSPRQEFQMRLLDANPCHPGEAGTIAPDGDAAVPDYAINHFRVPTCLCCDGTLMPDVVFFGGTVAREKVDAIHRALDDADALLVVGSSLMVYSAFRFCRKAAHTAKPMAAINLGKTRADDLIDVKLEADCASALGALL